MVRTDVFESTQNNTYNDIGRIAYKKYLDVVNLYFYVNVYWRVIV